MYKPDPIDIKLLNLLQIDASLTYKELASKLRRSVTNVADRIRVMKNEGYIKNTVVLVDISRLRSVFVAFPHIQLTNHSEDALKGFINSVSGYPEVMECYHLTGNFDFMLKVATPDLVSYNDFMRIHIGTLPHVGQIQSFLVLSEAKRNTAYPL